MIPLEMREKLGPLSILAGVWEGSKGDDLAPSDDRGTENNKFRERLTLEPIGAVQNHEQMMHALRYSTRAWRLGEENTFHEEVGYWTWEPATRQVMRCFLIPRGVSVIAGGTVAPDAREFTLKAEYGSTTYGICSNPFLDREFKILRFEVTVKILDDHTFSYSQDTVIQMPGHADVFHHTDQNILKRV